MIPNQLLVGTARTMSPQSFSLKCIYLVPFLQMDFGEASEPEGCSSLSLPKAICRGLQVINSSQVIPSISIKVKLPCLIGHQVLTCGIIGEQSAMKQLQN